MMKNLCIVFFFNFLAVPCFSQYVTKYPDIPRIDTHAHVSANSPTSAAIATYLAFRDQMLKECKTDIAMWIDVNTRTGGELRPAEFNETSKGRIMTCLRCPTPELELAFKAEDIPNLLKEGYVGYKIWLGGRGFLDNPIYKPVFSAMEKTGMPIASTHISYPNAVFNNRNPHGNSPSADNVVLFWSGITGLERTLQNHPNLNIVVAHGAWLLGQDAQIDFLRYLFSTYPNLYVDNCATDQFNYLVDRDNLRDLYIEYADRILFGTDIGRFENSEIAYNIARYARSFQILETDDWVEMGFFQSPPIQGLNLPREALEKIYYKNALKIYPGLANRMRDLGYEP
jgi:predicted TIM-barrel fold metal-dependent hydrolase